MNYSVAPLVLDDLDEIYAYVEDIKGEYDVFFWTALKRFAVVYRKTSPIAIVRVIPWPRMEPVLLTPAGGLWV
jgi:hypothetical protein